MTNSLCKRSNCKTLQTRLYKGIPALKNRKEQKADHLSVRAGDKVQMIYFQETIWLNYTCSARSDTGNVATVSITRDRHRKLQNSIKIPHGIAPHLKCACSILQSHRPKWVPLVAKETQSSSRLAPPPPFSMWTSGLSMTWNKSRWMEKHDRHWRQSSSLPIIQARD